MRPVRFVFAAVAISSCARFQESSTKVTIVDDGVAFVFEDGADDDHHVSCGPYVDYVNFFGYPAEDEPWTQFQVAVDIGLFAGEAGDELDIPDDAAVRVLPPFAATESEAVTLESGTIEIVRIDGGTPSYLKLKLKDGANTTLGVQAHGLLSCTHWLLWAPADVDAPIYDSEPRGGDGDD
jgi:hypothetical protein